MTKIELVFIPSTGIGHLGPIVKLAKQLITTDDRLSILVIIIPSATDTTTDTTTYIPQDRLRYESIIPVMEQPQSTDLETAHVYIEKQKTKRERKQHGLVSMTGIIWFCVPMVAWPLYAEHKVNAFEIVEKLGLAVEIKKCIGGDLVAEGGLETVTAEEIERLSV